MHSQKEHTKPESHFNHMLYAKAMQYSSLLGDVQSYPKVQKHLLG